jgi:branched-chain amino acid transport system permease protein
MSGGLRLRVVRDRGLARGGTVGALGGAGIAVAALIAFAALMALLFGVEEQDIILLFGINATIVIGLQLFVGNTGIMSFGHVAFMGLGAYAVGVVSVPLATRAAFLPDLPGFLATLTLPVVPAILFAGLIAGICGLIFGPLVVRLPESTATIITFGMLVVVYDVLGNAKSITRGTQTFLGVPKSTSYVLVFATLAVAVLVSAAFKWSPFGLRARAVREDPAAAEASGINVSTARLWPFVLSAVITGVGGGLWAFQVTAFTPNSFYIAQVIPFVAMMILGGFGSVSGALLGATVMSVWLELVRHVESGDFLHIPAIQDLSQLTLGILLVLLLRWRPSGLAGSRELQLTRGQAGTRSRSRGADRVEREVSGAKPSG